MKSSCRRLTCPSRNAYRPSVALWQHFILPSRRPVFAQQRFITSPSPGVPDASALPPSSLETRNGLDSSVDEVPESKDARKNHVGFRLRKITSTNTKDPILRNVLEARKVLEEMKDYEGTVVHPVPLEKGEKVFPRMQPWYLTESEPATGLDRLALEISRFHAYARPSRTEALARRHLIDQITALTAQTLPDKTLEVFGSERTGLSLATSDLDLRLVGADVAETSLDSTYPPSKAKRNRYLNDLLRLCRQLKQNRDFEHCNILYARYPLIQMRHRVSGTDIQIVLSNDTSLARSTVASYVEQYPYLQELYSVIKTMFDVRGLSDVLRGGFGSYPIFMMIVASLQHSPPERQDAAGALLNFLRFWHSHDTTNYGISINPTTLFEKNTETVMSKVTQRKLKSKQSTTQPNLGFMLCLRDPADPTNDLGRKGTSIKHVQATCKYLEQQITSSLDDPASLEGPILNSVVGPIFNLNLARRKRLEFYGNQAMPSVQTNLAAKAKNIFRAAWKGGEKEAAKEAQAVSNAAYSAHDDKLASLITMPTAREIAARQVQSSKADKETIAEPSSETDTTAQRVQRIISTSEEREESQAQYHQ